MTHTVRAFQQHAENFLIALKTRLFDEKVNNLEWKYIYFVNFCFMKSLQGNENTTDFAELFSMFVSSCEKVLALAIKR